MNQGLVLGVLCFPTTTLAAADEEGVAFFENKIRPILVARCYECHSQAAKQLQGGLRVDTRAGILQGGDSGPLIGRDEPAKSLLLAALDHDGDLQMPPSGKLPAAEIELFTQWLRRGAPLPVDGSLTATRSSIDLEKAREHWAFQPPQVSIPPASHSGRVAGRIDAFLRAVQLREGLTPSPPADRRTLLRRVSFDLLGLPPTAEDLAQFASDERPDAYERLVDRLLASPHYGERYGRYWLDLARYADGNATSLEVREHAWLYRDWIIQAFNGDLPYDEFVLRQLAADQLPQLPPAELAALGFLGCSPEYWKELKLAPAVIEQIIADEWEERIDALGRTFLGLSLACARCHDHKYDPVSTEDYYALAGILASTRLTERFVLPEPEAAVVRQAMDEVKSLREQIKQLGAAKTKSAEDKAFIADLENKIKSLESRTPNYHLSRAHAVEDAALQVVSLGESGTKLDYKAGEAIDLCVHIRGNPGRLGPQVPRRFLKVLSSNSPPIFERGSGRLELATAILREGAPLSARVIVNRVWKWHFGRGLVETTSDFGAQGAPPSHPELLDDLTCRFVERGWSLKWLHREVLTSAAYQQASTLDPAKRAIDPDNRWLWRMTPRRLDVEAWRDSMLCLCGSLDARLGGPAIARGAGDHHRRTIYGKIDRSDVDVFLRLFDFPDPAGHAPARELTTTSLQQLFVLNSPFMRQQATLLAAQLTAHNSAENPAIIHSAYQRLFARSPTATELQLGREFLVASNSASPSLDRLREYTQALLASSEFLFID